MIRIFDPRDKMRHFWRLEKGTYTVGRSKDCDLYIDDDTISRKHARIEIDDDDRIIIRDLGSHNGVVVNGNKITGPVNLNHNDFIEMGRLGLRVTTGDLPLSRRSQDSMIEIDEDLTSATMMPLKEALRPLSSKILEDPHIFKAISEMGKMLAVPGEDDKMFDKSLVLLREIIPLERAAIFLTDRLEGDVCTAVRSVSKDGDPGSFCISRTILREILSQKKAILISDPQSQSKFAGQQSIIMARIKSAMAVPLYDEGKIFGVLYADTSDPSRRYTEDYLRITATFGNMLAAKIMNNNLLKERRDKELLDAELAVASRIQSRLLPVRLPDIENFSLNAFQVQCHQVGGDLYDIARLGDGRIFLMIADVSGKGMGAALLASNILASFRIQYHSGNFDLLEATRRVSKQLLDFTLTGDYATLFVTLLDPASGDLSYVNAGHNPPMVVTRDGTVKHLEATGVPVGALDFGDWTESKIRMEAGDLLFVYTDGIPEAMDEKGELFGEDRLERFVVNSRDKNPADLTAAILAEIDGYVGDNPRSDDLTMIMLRRG